MHIIYYTVHRCLATLPCAITVIKQNYLEPSLHRKVELYLSNLNKVIIKPIVCCINHQLPLFLCEKSGVAGAVLQSPRH